MLIICPLASVILITSDSVCLNCALCVSVPVRAGGTEDVVAALPGRRRLPPGGGRPPARGRRHLRGRGRHAVERVLGVHGRRALALRGRRHRRPVRVVEARLSVLLARKSVPEARVQRYVTLMHE